MSHGYKHYSPHDHRAFGNGQTTVPWTGLKTFGTDSGTVDRADNIRSAVSLLLSGGVSMLGQEVCEDAERYGVAAARRIETVTGSVFIRYSVASCAFVFGQFL